MSKCISWTATALTRLVARQPLQFARAPSRGLILLLGCGLPLAFAELGSVLPPAAQAAPRAAKQAAPETGGEDAAVPPGGGDDAMDRASGGDTDDTAGTKPAPIPPTTGAPAPVTFAAYLNDGSVSVLPDVTWRIYEGHAAADGGYKLIKIAKEPRPTIALKPGQYLVNVAYGRANITKKIGIWPEKPVNEDFVINAGGLRLSATLAKAPVTAEHLVRFEIDTETQDQNGNREKLFADVRPGVVIRLNSGLYHVVSTYGDCNSVVQSDVVVEPGKITEAVIDHDAGKITLKLVQHPGGEAVADTRWTITNAAGEAVKESAGAFPTHILAAGDYRVTAQHADHEYSGTFTVAAGDSKIVEVSME